MSRAPRSRKPLMTSASKCRFKGRAVLQLSTTCPCVQPARTVDDGTLVLDQVPHCYIGYELRAKRAITRDELVALSPFLLLGPTDVGTEEDLAELEAAVAHTRTAGPDDVDVVVPAESTILRALESPNPWVRMAARRVALAGGEPLYPNASKRK